jgi:hypothetical protein
VPLSLTIMPGLLCTAINSASSRTTRLPDIEVSGTAARHSRVTSSTTLSTLEPAACRHLVVHEVEAPALVGKCRNRSRGTGTNRAFAPFTLPHGQSLLAAQQDVQAAISVIPAARYTLIPVGGPIT